MVFKPENSIPVGDADALQIEVEIEMSECDVCVANAGEEVSSLLDEIVDADTEIKSLKAEVKFLQGIIDRINAFEIKRILDSNSYLG